MMNSVKRPFSMHNPEESICSFCGELFYSHHGLQQYCPDKHGIRDYCRKEQKKMVSENRLAELAAKLSKAGINVNSDIDPSEKNIEILSEELGPYAQKTVTNETLDAKGYSIPHYTARVLKNGSNEYLLVVGPYTLEWISQSGDILIFKITKS